MGIIERNPRSAAGKNYDLIIIGGGIYGALIALEASRRSLNSLLLERADFGGATTFNCLRTLHGGFRYLQTLDLPRFYESVGERSWFQRNFPQLVEPLPCLMPLYGKGVRRPSILRVASFLNDVLSHNRNRGVLPEKHLPAGKIISVEETKLQFSSVDAKGLQGGVIWYDVCMPDCQLLLMEILSRACAKGATALNYVEAGQLLKGNGAVAGITATDLESGETHEYKSSIVVNAAGPWSRDIAASLDRPEPSLFRPSIAWNMLLSRNALSRCALAITPKKAKAHTYFLLPWKGKLLAGTGHKPWRDSISNAMPPDELMQEFIDDLNCAIPSLQIKQKDILYLFPGLLPAAQDGTATLAVREVILDHASHGGPRGLYSVSGVKFTTARLVAEKALQRIFPARKAENYMPEQSPVSYHTPPNGSGIFDFNWLPKSGEEKWMDALRPIVQDQSVQHLDDLMFRRTTLWDNPGRVVELAPSLCKLFPWDDSRCAQEIARVKARLYGG